MRVLYGEEPSKITPETHGPHNVNILDFNVLVKSNGFPFEFSGGWNQRTP